ncbi:uncharacterized protein LOC128963728 [Oppia nitens]|uniref:uncharacterized protein LOC128963728 n=1 Tax=Oppia nitens TaxID=1686743 RepID=UPI0023D9DC0D|nr:uncharacterized protein LOC128963728 [Oppia nitens]
MNENCGPFVDIDHIVGQLSRGDMIEVQRNHYSHWILCETVQPMVWCFHMTYCSDSEQPEGLFSTGMFTSDSLSFSAKALLTYEPLANILRDNGGNDEPSLCRINNQKSVIDRIAQEKTDRSNMLDINMDQVFNTLHSMRNLQFKYDLRKLNCEHYCTYWKYGIGWSSQVNTVNDTVITGTGVLAIAGKVAAQLLQYTGHQQNANLCDRMSDKSTGSFINHHNQCCYQLKSINKLVAKLKFMEMFCLLPFNLLCWQQITAIANMILLFGNNYLMAYLSSKFHQMCKPLARIQWRLNSRSFGLRFKLKLLAYFERLSCNRKIGLNVGPFGAMTFPMFQLV